MIARIVSNTPTWVWGLLAALVVLGLTQTRTRSAGLGRILILPFAMTGLSVSGTVSSFGLVPIALLAWAAATVLVAWLVMQRRPPAFARYDSGTGLFHLPGSWLPLALILGIFSIKYLVAVALAMQPALKSVGGFALVMATLYGALSGVFIGRAGRLWRLSRHPDRAPIAVEAAGPRTPTFRYLLRLAIGVPVAIGAVVVALVAFGTSKPPPPLTVLTSAILTASYRDLPALKYFTARDATPLAYRHYRASGGDHIAVLVHGSAGDSHAMHAVALALAKSGVTAYALDMRGHGASARRGDIDYIGQLDDDLADFVARLRAEYPKARLTMVGHSSGGGFTLRTAGGANRELFDRYLLLAPMLHHEAPTMRPNAGGWVQPFIPRIIGLSILDRIGLHWFEHLPVLAFALPAEAAGRTTPTYSYRLQSNFRPHADYLGDVRAIKRPTRVLVGAGDELFFADQYAPLLEPIQPRLGVRVLPGISHIGLVMQPEAIAEIVAELLSGT